MTTLEQLEQRRKFDPTGRYRIAENPALPAVCICGSNGEGKGLLDTGFDAEWHGVVYLCSNCVTNILDLTMGSSFINDEIGPLLDRIRELETELVVEQSKQLKLRNAINALRNAGFTDSDGADDNRSWPDFEAEARLSAQTEENESSDGDGTSEDVTGGTESGDSSLDELIDYTEPSGILDGPASSDESADDNLKRLLGF